MEDLAPILAAIAAAGIAKAEQRFLRKRAVELAVERLFKRDEVVQQRPDALDTWFADAEPLVVKAGFGRERQIMQIAELESSVYEWRNRCLHFESELEKLERDKTQAEEALEAFRMAHSEQKDNACAMAERKAETKVAALTEDLAERMGKQFESAYEAKFQGSLEKASDAAIKRGIAKGIEITAGVVRALVKERKPNRCWLKTFEEEIGKLQM